MDDPCCPQEVLDFQAEAENCAAAACDPTLESCCIRDLESAAIEARFKAQLSLHDRSKERLRAAGRVLGTAPPTLPPPAAGQQSGSDFESEEDDEEVGRLRTARLHQLQLAAQRKAELQQAGHGSVADVAEARLLREAESSLAPLVCHLALPGSPLDDELDEHLARLAHRFLGTRFARCAITLHSALHLRLRTPPGPGLLCFRGGSLVGAAGLDRFGAPECIREEAVDQWLRKLRMLAQPPGGSASTGAAAAAAAAAAKSGGRAQGRARGSDADSGSSSSSEEGEAGEEWEQPCEVCGRRYPHQHIRSAYAGDGGRGSGSDSESDAG